LNLDGLIVTLFGGCYSLRRKFVRKNKSYQRPFVYVDFKQYPPTSPQRLYKECYFFITGWFDELIDELNDGNNYKREKNALQEIIRNLKQINSQLTAAGSQKLSPIYEAMIEIKDKISPCMTEMDKTFLLHRLNDLKLRFNNHFSYSKVYQWIKQN